MHPGHGRVRGTAELTAELYLYRRAKPGRGSSAGSATRASLFCPLLRNVPCAGCCKDASTTNAAELDVIKGGIRRLTKLG